MSLIKCITTTRIDENTGEIISESSREYKSRLWVDGKGAKIKTKNYHCTLYQDAKLSSIINDKNDLLKTYLLIENIYKDTNIIYIQKSSRNWKPANIEDISHIIGVNTRRTKEYIKRMIDVGILSEIILKIKDIEYISYVFNPVYVNSCRYINNTLYLLFKPYVDKHCPEWIKKKYEEMNKEYNEEIFEEII
jgi:hypothetical protein